MFLLPFLWALERCFQIHGIWLAFPAAEISTFLVALLLLARHQRRNLPQRA